MRFATRSITLILVCAALHSFASAQLARQWVARYSGTAKQATDIATAMAIDDSGSVCVTGYSLRGSSASNIVTVKYASDGTRKWVNTYAGSGNARGTGIAVDTAENVYVCASVDSGGSTNYLIMKFGSAGNLKWKAMFDGPAHGTDVPVAIIVTNDSLNVFVTGYSAGTGTGLDFSTQKYDSTGHLMWENLLNGNGNGDDKPCAMAYRSPTRYSRHNITDRPTETMSRMLWQLLHPETLP